MFMNSTESIASVHAKFMCFGTQLWQNYAHSSLLVCINFYIQGMSKGEMQKETGNEDECLLREGGFPVGGILRSSCASVSPKL